MILALDPSLTCCGWALLESRQSLVNCGRIRPRGSKTPLADRLQDLSDGLESLRIKTVAAVVIEVPSGHVGRNRHGGSGAGLSLYGLAVGYTIGHAQRLGPIHLVTENDWTGSTPKDQRTAIIRATVPAYRQRHADKDAGGDIADAIGLGQWWFSIGRLLK